MCQSTYRTVNLIHILNSCLNTRVSPIHIKHATFNGALPPLVVEPWRILSSLSTRLVLHFFFSISFVFFGEIGKLFVYLFYNEIPQSLQR